MRVLWRAECCMAQAASVTLQFGLSTLQLSLSDHLSQWPAALLTGLGAPWNTLQPEGQLQWRTEGLQLRWSEGRLQMTGKVELQVQQLSSRLSTLKPMGSYRLQLAGTAEGTAPPACS